MDRYFADWSALFQKAIQRSREQQAGQVDEAQLSDAFSSLTVYRGAVTDGKLRDHPLTGQEMFMVFEES